jgi:L-alanine-DL-glutamate epimerase-like enolase superfamily enzyme
MNITSVSFGVLRSGLPRPFKTALRTVTELEEITIRLCDSDGLCGWGSVVPTAAITGDTAERINSDLSLIVKELVDVTITDVWQWRAQVPSARLTSQTALCAVDVALHDLAARRAGQTMWQWLGGKHANRVLTNKTISIDSPQQMAEDAINAVAKGYRALKIKVGVDAEVDKQRLAAIRSVIDQDITLRLDANQGWSLEEALQMIPWCHDMCEPVDFIEQPVAAADLAAMAEITRMSPIPILADESAMTFEQALAVINQSAAHALSVKLIKAGGVSEALRILELAHQQHIPCLMSCMFEAGAGLQASAQIAVMHPAVRWADLDTGEFLHSPPYEGGVRFDGPAMSIGEGAGLAIDLSHTLDVRA